MAADGSIVIEVTLDDTQAEDGVKKLSDSYSGLGSKLKSGLGTAAKVGTAAVAAVTGATVGLGTALVKQTGDIASFGDNIDKMSQKMGMSAEAYQEWDAVMQHSGTSIESMQSSMKTLASAAETGKDAFEKLGISQEEIANMNQEELFGATITALQNVESETERTYLAGQLLGRGATELGALLNTSAEDTQAMKDRVHELGGVMSNEAVSASAAFQDSLQDMQTGFTGMKNSILSEFLPGITEAMDGITAFFSGDTEGGLAMITESISAIVEGIEGEIPMILESGREIVDALVQAITSNLPSLIDAAVQIIIMIAEGLIQNLPKLVEAALQIIKSLAQGLIDNLPTLIPAIIDVILQIVDTLTSPDNIVQLVEAALKIIVALAEGLIKALPQLIAKVPEIIMNLVEALIKSIPKVLEAAVEIGEAIIEGIWDGITGLFSWLWDQITGFFDWIVGGIKDLLGIHSPSRVFAGIGRNMALGVGEGWSKEFNRIRRTIEGNMDFSAAVGYGNIPALANGAVIPPNKEFLAVLGDQRNGTNVETPVSEIESAVARGIAQAGVGGGSGGSNAQIVLQIDGVTFARLIGPYTQKESARVGINLVDGVM